MSGTYAVKEVFYSLQCEGANAGRPAVLLRFSGCNLWSGREADRPSAVCKFCDTDFLGGARCVVDELAAAAWALWPGGGRPLVVLTGGEPMLQVDVGLVAALRRAGFYEVAVETNGTVPVPPRRFDWVTVSPKAGAELVQRSGDELKLVFPQEGLDPAELIGLDFGRFFLQPMDGPDLAANTAAAVRYCLDDPRWSLSLQTHKTLGLR